MRVLDSRRRFLAAVGLVAVGALVVGCSSAKSGSAADSGSPSTGQSTQDSSTGTNTDSGTMTFGYAIPDLTLSFWTSYTYGIEQAAKENGIKIVRQDAGGDANAETQINQLRSLGELGVDAVIVGATDGDAVVPEVETLVSKGIPVIGVSSIPNSPKLAAMVVTDNKGMGEVEAECLAPLLSPNAQVGAIAGPDGQSWADARLDGFVNKLAELVPGAKVVATSRLADTTDAGFTTMRDWITRFPDLEGIYTATDDIAVGAVNALKTDTSVKIHIATSNFGPSDEAFVRDGTFVCTAAQEVVDQGRKAIEAAIAAVHGELGTETKVFALPVTRIDASNIDSVDMSPISAPEGYKPN